MKKLQNRTWAVLAVFSIVILLITWGFQTLFFNTLYLNQEVKRIEALGNDISERWKNVRFSQPVSIRFYEDEVPVRIFNSLGAKTVDDVSVIEDPDPLGAGVFINKYEASGNAVYIDTPGNSVRDTGFIVYGRKIPNPDNIDNSLYVYIVDPLGPLNSVRAIMTQELMVMFIVTMLLAVVLSYFMASTVAKPIVDLTDQAKLLAKGDYSVRFSDYNISEIQQLSETLNTATEQLAQIDETKNELLASVSHDLRTPLTMIQAYAEMIRDFSGDDRNRRNEHIGIIIQETDWMSRLITDILEYSRIRSGTMNYEMRSFDLAELTSICVEKFTEVAAKNERNVSIEWENPGFTPVWGDITRIQRVINNLCDNAMKFTREGSSICIKVYNKDGKTFWEVRDHGPGIPEDNIESIWDRYFSRDITSPRKQGSTGLGLSIVRGILRDHGAGYGVKSHEGEGSVFWFSLRSEQEI